MACANSQQCSDLQSQARPSVLRVNRGMDMLVENSDTLPQIIIQEAAERTPFLLDVLYTTVSSRMKMPSSKQVGPLSTCYSVLLKERDMQLSAFHRMTTLVCLKGKLDDRAMTRFQRLGFTLSPASKLNILAEAGKQSRRQLIAHLEANPLMKILGDNLDIFIRSFKGHVDLHLFTSLAIFSRVATPDIVNVPPIVTRESITAEKFVIHGMHETRLKSGYKVLLARIWAENLDAFGWMQPLIPKHTPHPYADRMATKSVVHPLPLLQKNEARHEDCVDIMDSYEETLTELYRNAHGDLELLDKFKCVIGGDQLTRKRLQDAKHLRILAPDDVSRLVHLDPIVCEMWHTKQDLLEKAYKQLFKKSSLRQPGTLYYYKVKTKKTEVNGKVKSNYQAHENLLLAVGRQALIEQTMEFFSMTAQDSQPQDHVPPGDIASASREDQHIYMDRVLSQFLDMHRYGHFNLAERVHHTHKPEAVIRQTYTIVGRTANGDVLVAPVYSAAPPAPPAEDRMYNYTANLCQWALQIMELNDTAKEGDITRVIGNMMMNIPFFFSHSKLSKYFVECIIYILKAEYLASPLQKVRVLEGSFVNTTGGKGNSVESDLKVEHTVRNRKALIAGLGAGKTDRAMERVTDAADAVASVVQGLDVALEIQPKSTRHAQRVSDSNAHFIRQNMHALRPFHRTAGRECEGFPSIQESVFDRIDKQQMCTFIERNVQRILRGQETFVEDEDDDDDPVDIILPGLPE